MYNNMDVNYGLGRVELRRHSGNWSPGGHSRPQQWTRHSFHGFSGESSRCVNVLQGVWMSCRVYGCPAGCPPGCVNVLPQGVWMSSRVSIWMSCRVSSMVCGCPPGCVDVLQGVWMSSRVYACPTRCVDVLYMIVGPSALEWLLIHT